MKINFPTSTWAKASVLAGIAAVGTMGAAILLGGAPAYASGVIGQPFGTACIPHTDICWPGSEIWTGVAGSGDKVTEQDAQIKDVIGGSGNGGYLCNWRIDFSDQNSDGKNTYYSTGTTNTGCTTKEISRTSTYKRTLAKGTVQTCATLYDQENAIVRACIDVWR